MEGMEVMEEEYVLLFLNEEMRQINGLDMIN